MHDMNIYSRQVEPAEKINRCSGCRPGGLLVALGWYGVVTAHWSSTMAETVSWALEVVGRWLRSWRRSVGLHCRAAAHQTQLKCCSCLTMSAQLGLKSLQADKQWLIPPAA